MEKIKKIIKQAITTGTTENSPNNTFIIIPDENAEYHFSILLTSRAIDLGFFDAYVENEYPYYPYLSEGNEYIGIGESLLY